MALTQISTQGIKDGTITGSDLATNVDLVDNQKLRLGTGNDLQIYHNGNHSYIEDTGTGNLILKSNVFRLRSTGDEEMIIANENGNVQLYHNNVKKLETTSAGVLVSGSLTADGGNAITLGDNKKIVLGTGSDLEIYHDGSNSFIADEGTGALRILSNDARIINAAGTEDMARFIENGAVELYFDNSKKFETTSTGVSIDGNITAGDNNHLFLGDSQDINIYHDGSDSYFYSGASTLFFRNASNEKFASFISNGAVELYHNNSKKFETHSGGVNVTGSVNPTGNVALLDNSKLKLGTGDDLKIYHSTANNIIQCDNGMQLHINKGDTENIAKFIPDGAVELYYDNSKKFETTSLGATLTGRLISDGLDVGDSESLRLGNNYDLQIFHDGTSSLIKSPSHPIAHYSNTRHHFLNGDGSENMAVFVADGQCELYHNGTKMFETTSDGGTLQKGLTVRGVEGGEAQIRIEADEADNASDRFRLLATDSAGFHIQSYDGSQYDTLFKGEISGGVELSYNNSKKFETTSTGIAVSGNSNTFSAGANALNTTFSSAFGGAGATSVIRVAMNTSANDGLQIQQNGSGTSVSGGNHASSIFNREDARLRLGTDNTEQFRIEANGDLKANDTSIGSLSDSRLKKNIVDFTYDLNKFKQFKPKKFDWINPELHGNKSDVRGFVAQEIEIVDSTLVGNYELYDETLTDKNPDLAIIEADDGTNIAKDSKLGTNDAMYISVIQQMLTKIEVLETEVAALKAA